MAVSSIVCAVAFSTIFKRKLFLTIIFFNSFSIMYQVFSIALSMAAPAVMQPENAWIPDWFLLSMFGFVDSITIIFLTLIGPLIIASRYKKTYEVTMGGTIIAVCIAVPFIIKSLIECIVVYILPILSVKA